MAFLWEKLKTQFRHVKQAEPSKQGKNAKAASFSSFDRLGESRSCCGPNVILRDERHAEFRGRRQLAGTVSGSDIGQCGQVQ